MSEYSKAKLDSYYFKTKSFYFFFIPIGAPYKKIYAMADSAGVKQKEKFGPILESGKMFGFGWIGVAVEKPAVERLDVVYVQGEFNVYEYKGPYQTLGNAYKKIMKEHSRAKEYYNLYIDDPVTVPAEQLRTRIHFR